MSVRSSRNYAEKKTFADVSKNLVRYRSENNFLESLQQLFELLNNSKMLAF